MSKITKIRDLLIYNTQHLVLVDEEYGYKQWLWLPDFPLNELEDFWKNLKDVPVKHPTSVLTGLVVSFDCASQPPVRPRAQKFWNRLEKQPHYFAHVWNNSHSFLITPEGKRINLNNGC